MSSRYGFEEQASERENVLSDLAEAPLPTYEEVVGASQTHIGFKHDVLLPPRSAPDAFADRNSRQLPGTSAQGSTDLEFESRPKRNTKAIILVLLAAVLIPLCATIIIIQTKVCSGSTTNPVSQHDCLRDQNRFNLCIDDKNAIESQCTSEINRLQTNYDTANKHKEILDQLTQDLRKRISRLTEERDNLKKKLAEAEKATTEIPKDISFADLLKKIGQGQNIIDKS